MECLIFLFFICNSSLLFSQTSTVSQRAKDLLKLKDMIQFMALDERESMQEIKKYFKDNTGMVNLLVESVEET